MTKREALIKYLSARPRIKHAIKRICDELCDMKHAWKKDMFAPQVTSLDGLGDAEFVKKYLADFDKTVQHEGAEALEEICLFFEAHGVNILEYLPYLERYRKLMSENPLENTKVTPIVQPIALTKVITADTPIFIRRS